MAKRRVGLAAILAGASMMVFGSPAQAGDGCFLPKPGCTVYYKVCSVAYEAGLQCAD